MEQLDGWTKFLTVWALDKIGLLWYNSTIWLSYPYQSYERSTNHANHSG